MITAANDTDEHEEESSEGPKALMLLQEIKAGHLDPKSIRPVDRGVLVSVLMAEGQSTAEMAHLLGVSDKTIERDKKAIREQNAIPKDPKFIEQMVGRLVSEAETCIQRIRKALRERDATVADRVDGEHRCFQVLDTLAERLQRLGYLPTATQRLEAEVVGQWDHSLPTLAEIQHESLRLAQIHNRRLVVPSNQAAESVARFEDSVATSVKREGDLASAD